MVQGRFVIEDEWASRKKALQGGPTWEMIIKIGIMTLEENAIETVTESGKEECKP